MNSFLLEMVLVSGILSGYYVIFLRNKRFHTFNRFYLLFILLVSAVIPFIHIPIVLEGTSQIVRASQSIGSFISTNNTPVDSTFSKPVESLPPTNNPFPWLWYAYGLVSLILMGRLIFIFMRIARLVGKHPVEKIDGILLVNTNENDAPFTFHKWLFWNSGVELDRVSHQQIMNHESVHIRQRHTIDIVLAEILTCVFWINPFFYLVKKELKAVHEFLADSSIVTDRDRAVFSKLILFKAMGRRIPIAHNFFDSITSRRITMMTQAGVRENKNLQKALCTFLAFGTLTFFSFDSVRKTSFLPVTKEMDSGLVIVPGVNSKTLTNSAGTNQIPTNRSRPDKSELPLIAPVVSDESEQKNDEISLLNYRENAISYAIAMPENNVVPAFVHTRSDVTQVLIGSQNNDPAVFYPARKYDELVLIFNKHTKTALSGDWRLHVLISDEAGNVVKNETLTIELISNFESVRISFSKLPKGSYHLQAKSSDQIYSTSCKVVKDFDG